MEAKTIHCAGCGKTASGNFCSHCGAPLLAACPACGAEVRPGSRACSQCGLALAGQAQPRRWTAQTIAPWAALGLAALALTVALGPWSDRSSSTIAGAPVRFSQLSAPGAPAPGQPPDLSTMSPREAADRLFNRVMTASENGATEEAQRFAPMAIQAYERAGPLDNDGRYHVALVYLTTGDSKSARAQIAKLRATAPNHLFGFMVEHQIAVKSGDSAAADRATRAFEAAYDQERATGRVEYQEHAGGVERFHTAAQAGTPGKR